MSHGTVPALWRSERSERPQRQAEAQLTAFGNGLVWISAGSRNISGVRNGSHAAVTVTAEDAEAILADVPRIRSVALQSETPVTISPNGNRTTRARGISVSFLDTWWWTIAEGAAFIDRDVDEAEPAVLLGHTVRERLFGDAFALPTSVARRRAGHPQSRSARAFRLRSCRRIMIQSPAGSSRRASQPTGPSG